MKHPIKIPTLLGIFLTIVIVFIFGYAFNYFFGNNVNANPSVSPVNIQFSNISDSGFTVTWNTSNPATGAVIISINGKSVTRFDERDTSGGKLGKYNNHYINIHDLKPSTFYKLKILSNGKKYSDNGKDYSVMSASILEKNTNGMEPAFGTILLPDGKSAEGAITFLKLENSQLMSALVGPTGSWLIPLNQIRTADMSENIPKPKERLTESIKIIYNQDFSEAETDTLNDSPVPEMIIGKTYDFRKTQADSAPLKTMGNLSIAKTIQNNVLGETTDINKSKSFKISITQPQDNATLVSNIPLIKGTGVPGNEILLTIGIKNPQTANTTVNADGLWSYIPKIGLEAGKQSVTITTKDNFNKSIAITHSFEVLKSGTQVLGIATPSGTLIPTPTEYLEPEPTFEPTPTSTLSGQEQPTSGSFAPTVILILISFTLLLGGTLSFIRQ